MPAIARMARSYRGTPVSSREMKKPPEGGSFQNGLAYSCGPALLMASLTSNFLKFSMNLPARPLAASS